MGGFGVCFNLKKSMGIGGAAPSDCNVTLEPSTEVAKMIHAGAHQVCPSLGRTMECYPGQLDSRCNQTRRSHRADTSQLHVDKIVSLSHCWQSRPCGPLPGMPQSFQVEVCECGLPSRYFSPCIFSKSSCAYGSYYPTWESGEGNMQDFLVSV